MKCDTYVIRSINHEMYLQGVTKTSQSAFDEKRKNYKNSEGILRE